MPNTAVCDSETMLIEEQEEKKKKRNDDTDCDMLGYSLAAGGVATVGFASASSDISDFGSGRQYNLYSARQGQGFVGEDMALEKHREWSKAPLGRQKNEPDLYTQDGTPVQVKCCKDASRAVTNMFEDGKYRYGEDIIAVPDEQVEEVSKRLSRKGVETEVVSIGASYDDTVRCRKRGVAAACYDALCAARRPGCITIGVSTALAASIYFYGKEKKSASAEHRKPKRWRVALKSIGLGAAAYAVSIGFCVAKEYAKRPQC